MHNLLEEYFDRLWPICRSISGKGYQESLDILSELIPFEKIDFESGTKVHDWIVPDEWNIRDAKIIGPAPKSETILDFADNNLHVIGYSEPANGFLPWRLLRNHVYTIPEMPDAIPYITSYYKRRWGFCMTYNQFMELEKSPDTMYTFNIDSSLAPGKITVGESRLHGKLGDKARDIFLTSYLCHPSMAINELSGPLVMAGIYLKLKEMGQLNNNVLFYIGPENIGAVAYLAKQGFNNLNVLAGYVINCVGHKRFRYRPWIGEMKPDGVGRVTPWREQLPEYVYKRSRQHNSLADRAALHVLKHKGVFFEKMDFFPDGSDERQWCSPGYNLPMGLLMRHCYGDYPEYHTSKDDKSLMDFEAMEDMIDTYIEVIKVIDKNRTYMATVQYGTPFFSKNEKDGEALYRSTMNLNSFHVDDSRRVMLDLINWSTGKRSLLQIAEKTGHHLLDLADMAEVLVESGYLKEVASCELA